MEIFVTIVVALGVGAGVAVLLLRDRAPDPSTSLLPAEVAALRDEFRMMSERLSGDTSGLGRRLEQRLEGIDSRMTVNASATQELASGIFETLGDVRQATATVAEQAREFTLLQDLLKPPKARGGVGEALLEELLRQVLPPQAFSVQHRFASGVIVDAVVRLGGRAVCIDSKFPLSNYRRMCDARDDSEKLDAERAFAADVDKHIRDIAARYVAPDEDTFDFAVMYVPAEGVYSEVLRLSHRRRPLFEAAIEARVVPMSPLTMYGYLQTVAFGLKCLRIEKSAEKVLGYCGRLEQDLERFTTEYDILGKHLSSARSKYEEGTRRLDRFRDRLEHVADLADEDAGPRPSLEVVAE